MRARIRDVNTKSGTSTLAQYSHFCTCLNQNRALLVSTSLPTTGAYIDEYESVLVEMVGLEVFIVAMYNFAQFFDGVIHDVTMSHFAQFLVWFLYGVILDLRSQLSQK